MKWLALALLLVNLAAAAFFLLSGRDLAGSQTELVPLNTDRLALRSAHRSDKPALPSSPASTVSAGALCVEWRGLNPDEFGRVREALKTLAGERVMSFSEVPLNVRYWVIFPTLPSRAAATAKLAELAALGIADAFVVKDGPWANALSLGLYTNEEPARRRVLEMEDKGVLGARIELQPRQGSDYYFIIKSEDGDTLKGLNELRQPYPNSQLSRIACPS